MTNRFAFINNEFIDERNACLHVSDLSIQRGYGVFDYCRTTDNVPMHLDDHVDRFLLSAKIMHLQMPLSKEELISTIQTLTRKNQIPQSGIRMLLTGGYSPDSYEVVKPNLVILQHPLLFKVTPGADMGIKVITQDYVREFPEAKTINYSMGIWIQPKLRAKQATDVLYHKNGEVSEFPRSNFFIVTKEDVIATPGKNILKGITRKKILELKLDAYKVEERPVTLEDIRYAKEAFMSSTTKRVLPIIQVDDMIIGHGRKGPVTEMVERELVKAESLLPQ